MGKPVSESPKKVCPACNFPDTVIFLKRDSGPVHQNLVLRTRSEALQLTRTELVLSICHNCGFVFNVSFDESLLSYGQNYDNCQFNSRHFKAYIEGRIRELVENRGLRDKQIVEIGCGKGEFLRALVSYPGSGNTGIGYDPSYLGPLEVLGGRIKFKKEYYGVETDSQPADVVVCRHLIEHIENPLTFLENVRRSIKDTEESRLFLETPCVDWILTNSVIQDFFYEHCSLFTEYSLGRLLKRCDFDVIQSRHVFNGQYLWVEAKPSGGMGSIQDLSQEMLVVKALGYGIEESRLIKHWQTWIRSIAPKGSVAIWGAAAKGVTFTNLIDPEETFVNCLVDLNSNKQGCFIPGTGHPVVSPLELPSRGVSHAIIMNPNYTQEIRKILKDEGMELVLKES